MRQAAVKSIKALLEKGVDDTRIRQALMEALEDEHTSVRRTAVEQLAGPPWAIRSLRVDQRLRQSLLTQALPILRRLAEREKEEPTHSTVLNLSCTELDRTES